MTWCVRYSESLKDGWIRTVMCAGGPAKVRRIYRNYLYEMKMGFLTNEGHRSSSYRGNIRKWEKYDTAPRMLDPAWCFGSHSQGWNFGRFLVLLGFRRLYSLSGKHSPSIPFPSEPEIPGTQSTRLRPKFHTESLIGKPKII